MMKWRCPRVLVLSINAFNKSGSNGRVLSELFEGWDKDCLAQFYIYDENPNSNVCKNYFRVTDKEAMKSFLFGRKFGKRMISCDDIGVMTQKANTIKKNPLTYLCRDIIWSSGRWKSKVFWAWIDEFQPECILWQADNSSFMPTLVLQIAKKYNIPIAIFNTENYYFKEHNYFSGKGFGFVYPLYKRMQNNAFKKLIKKSCLEIYNSENLATLYQKKFKKHGEVIYQGTSLLPFRKETNNKCFRFLYAGNLGLNRHISLIQLANVLQSLSEKYYLDVYGAATGNVAKELKNCQGIRYHGVVPYDRVLQEMEESDFLCHVESFDANIVKDLATAFSTKISDYLASGRCMILYADDSLACTQYLLKNNCACVITKPENLFEQLQTLLNSIELQIKYKETAIIVAAQNHNSVKNSYKFKKLLIEAINTSSEINAK